MVKLAKLKPSLYRSGCKYLNNKNATFSTQHSFGSFHKKSLPNNFVTWTQLTSWQRSLAKKIKSAIKPSDLIYSVVEAYSSFHNMKQLGLHCFSFPPPPHPRIRSQSSARLPFSISSGCHFPVNSPVPIYTPAHREAL